MPNLMRARSAGARLLSSVRLPALRVSDEGSPHTRSFIEFLTKPRPFLLVFHFSAR
jgi:hypothetical protein